MRWEAVIGIEIHVQLRTSRKLFCGDRAVFGDAPNTNVCPVCLGLPGALPTANPDAVRLAVRTALALDCTVHPRSIWARKHYFYPDLPKGYQITQFEQPLATGGRFAYDGTEGESVVRIRRVHMEEDAGKSIHDRLPGATAVDLNRAGTPLVEIVTEPDLHDPADVRSFLTALKQVLEYIEVSDCDMVKGSLRCDANVSVRPVGTEKFGVKTEVKNLNSFRYLAKALEYEIDRQVALLESGGRIEQETRLWNTQAGRTEPMRSKEHAHDYRYFPEPDLLPLVMDAAWVEDIRRAMPELPAAKEARFVEHYGLSDYDAEVLTANRALADYFEATAAKAPNAKTTANWIQTELLGALKEAGREISRSPVPPQALAELLQLVEDGTLSGKMGKTVFEKMFASGKSARAIVAAEKMEQITDAGEIEKLCGEVLAKNADKVEQYKKGKQALFGFFVGQVMKATRGQANPRRVNDTLKKLLG